MNNFFILANNYISKTLSYGLNHLLHTKIDNLYLLDETNNRTDMFLCAGKDYSVNIADFDTCLESADTILVCYDDYFTEDRFRQLTSKMKIKNKKIYELSLHTLISANTNIRKSMDSLPTIMLFNYGKLSQAYISEVLINRFFHNQGVKFQQNLLSESYSWLKQLQDKYNTINESVILSLEAAGSEQEINVITIDLNALNWNDTTERHQINDLLRKSIYNVLLLEAGTVRSASVADAFLSFELKYDYKLNAIVESQFTSINIWNSRTDVLYNGDMGVYIQDINGGTNYTNNLNDLLDNIKHTISLPDNVNLIQIDG